MAELTRDVNERNVQSAYVCAPFDLAYAKLKKAGYKIIEPEQFAQLRIAKGASHNVSSNGAYTSMGDVMIPQKGRFLTQVPFVLRNPAESTQAHRQGKEVYISNEDAENALPAGSVQIPYKQSSVPTDRFAEDPITVFVFGKTAKEYGAFLKEAGIEAMPLWFNDEKYINSQKSPFANQLWLHGLGGDNGSVLIGYGRCLSYNNAVRGVRYVEPRSGETATKISTPKLKEIVRYSRQFVPQIARKDFEKGLEALFRKQ